MKNHLARILHKGLQIKKEEITPSFLAFTYHFCLLSGYFILRPVRDEMGIQAGINNLQWLFTGTFFGMLLMIPFFGYLTRKYPRKKLLPIVYLFFLLNILIFYFTFNTGVNPRIPAIIFFIWTSVYNLFIVSVFWSFMTDIFSNEQARRLFGFLMAGGSLGAILGPSITALLATVIGTVNLLLISAFLLFLAVICILHLLKWSGESAKSPQPEKTDSYQKPIGGSIWAGIRLVFKNRYLKGISLFIIFYTTISTFLYFEQAHIVSDEYTDSGMRTTYFAVRDIGVNSLTILIQLFVTGRLMSLKGLSFILLISPVIAMAGLFSLGVSNTLIVIAIVQILYRSGNFSLQKPGREVLYTVIDRESRYKAKNFIDTTVYRGGDMVSGWAFTGLLGIGLSLTGIAFIAIPITIIWGITGFYLGKKHDKFKIELENERDQQTKDTFAEKIS